MSVIFLSRLSGSYFSRLLSSLGLLFFGLSFFSQSSFAQASGGGGSGRYELFMSAGDLGLSANASQFDISPGIQLAPFPLFSWFQIGGEADFQKVSYMGSSSMNLLAMLGATINIGPNIPDDVFMSIGAAYRSGSAPTADGSEVDPNGLGFYFLAGKRIPINGSFSMRPSMGIVSCGTTGVIFRPFAVSYAF